MGSDMGVSSLTQYPCSRTFSLNLLLLGITMAPQRPCTIAYLRVSTSEQDVTKNQADILMLAHRKHLGHVQFVEETVSSRVPWRRRKASTCTRSKATGNWTAVCTARSSPWRLPWQPKWSGI